MSLQKFFTFMLACNILLWIFIAAGPSQNTFDKITVKEFELVDDKGTRRVSVRVEPEGEVVFRMMDNSGTIRVKLGADENGSGLVLLDQHTNPAVHVLAKDNGASLTVTDKTGRKKQY